MEKEFNRDIELTFRIRNAKLVDAVQKCAIERNTTVTDLLRRNGAYGLLATYYALASFKKTPQDKKGIWRRGVMDICEILNVIPETLFDLDLYEMPIKKNVVKRYMTKEHLMLMQGSQFAGLLPAETETPEDYMERVESVELLKKEFERVFEGRSERNVKIIKMYFGVGVDKEYSLQELSDEFKLSREGIRQIVKRLLEHMRQHIDVEVVNRFC